MLWYTFLKNLGVYCLRTTLGQKTNSFIVSNSKRAAIRLYLCPHGALFKLLRMRYTQHNIQKRRKYFSAFVL